MRVWENWFTTRSQWSLGRTTTTTSNTITPVSAANIEHTHNSFRRSMHVLFVGMDCCDDEWCWCWTRNIRHSEEEEIAYGTMADASCAKFTMRLNQNDKCLLWRLFGTRKGNFYSSLQTTAIDTLLFLYRSRHSPHTSNANKMKRASDSRLFRMQ